LIKWLEKVTGTAKHVEDLRIEFSL